MKKGGVERHSPDGKSFDKNAKEKIEVNIKDILESKWTGNNLLYYVSLQDGQKLWLKANEFNADTLVKEYHEAFPNAASPNDYKISNSWKTIKRKEKTIQSKFNSKEILTAQEIDFIAFNLTSTPKEPKEFKRVHLKISNKRAIANCSFNQKQNIIRKILHSYGLSANVIRISFIGASVIEIYIQSDSESRFISCMKSHGWEFINEFDFYDTKSFDGKEMSESKKMQCMEALIQRLAFLSASTHLVNLQKCILEDLHEETKELVLKRKEEIIESRAGERTAYVQQRS
jgi:hypothetical protein